MLNRHSLKESLCVLRQFVKVPTEVISKQWQKILINLEVGLNCHFRHTIYIFCTNDNGNLTEETNIRNNDCDSDNELGEEKAKPNYVSSEDFRFFLKKRRFCNAYEIRK